MPTRYRNYRKSGKALKFESFMGDIDKELNRAARRQRMKAGSHVKKKLKEVTTQKFGKNSNITKGIGHRHLKTTTIVGIGPPAQAAHLIEFGTDDRYHKSGKSTGRVKKDPFVVPVYRREAPEVRRILSEEWF